MEKMGQFIGYPDELLDRGTVDGYYQKLQVDEANYFQNQLNAKKFKSYKTLSKLREVVDPTHWQGFLFSWTGLSSNNLLQ